MLACFGFALSNGQARKSYCRLQVLALFKLLSRRLEVVGARKNGGARERHARGERACLPLVRPFFLPSACYAGQALFGSLSCIL